ncbi:MAG: outer membrane lipoprotein-sorting protein [Nitrospinae bacterium]|nr:outer membrane lipoprotein-sorting protein [Nitrospinota bacterium]
MKKNILKGFLCSAFLLTLIGFLLLPQRSQTEDAKAFRLLVEVDNNMWATTKYIDGRLIIDNGRRVRELAMESWMEGVTRSYSYYKSPPRERGTKMLKLDKKLWMYTPQTDRKILIAGHMLRQSMMGSDLSYEDMMEDEKLSEAYTGTIDGEEELEGVKTLVMTLKARKKTKTYQILKIWTDPVRKIVLKQEAYAKSGKLLKLIYFREYRRVGNRLFPRKMVFHDMLKKNTQTTYMFDKIEFDVTIPKKYFSIRILKR